VLADIEGLPARAFEVSGALLREKGHTAFQQVRVQIGDNDITLDGVLGTLPRMVDTDLTFAAEGPDLSIFSTLIGADLPAKRFSASGHLVRREDGIGIKELVARIGEATFGLAGEVGDWPQFAGTSLDLNLSCPDASVFGRLVGFDLPAAPVDLRGRLRPGRPGLVLQGVDARLGSDRLRVDGNILRTHGFIGTDLRFQLSGPDLSHVAILADREPLPAAPFEVAGHLRVLEQGYGLDAIEARVGNLDVRVDGRLSSLLGGSGTELDVVARGEDLSVLGDYLEVDSLPSERFSVRGHVGIRPEGYRLEDVVAQVGAHDIEAEGTLVPTDGLVGTDITAQVAGPTLADAARLLSEAGVVDLSGLPEEPYDISGRVHLTESGYQLRGMRAQVGEAQLHVDGILGTLPDGHGSDLSLELHGPDGTLVGAIAGVDLPAEPFAVSGRVQWETSGARFHDIKLRFGGYLAEIDGALGEPPKLIGTRLDIRAEGPGLTLLSQFVELPVSDAPFVVSGHLDGTPEQFALSDFAARLGDSDLNGFLHVDLLDKPVLHGDFTSKHVDISTFLEASIPPDTPQPSAPAAEPAPAPPEREADDGDRPLLIPDDPLSLSWLRSHDADVHWQIADLDTLLMSYHGVEFDLTLQEGRLQVGPLRGDGDSGGSISGSVTLEPDGEAHRLTARLTAEQLRYALSSAAEKREERSPHDIRIELTGSGKSLHSMASSANGHIIIGQGEGQFDIPIFRRLTTDALAKVISALNPFADRDRYARLECGVHVILVEDGVATLQPLVVVTDRMKIIGHGEIDLKTEKLDLNWAAKPRKGIGLSASTITNPYVKLGGTLSAPSVTVRPLTATAATAAAFTTGGLSILAKGFWDRVTSGKRTCTKVKKKAGLR
jgi:hypothetical protein